MQHWSRFHPRLLDTLRGGYGRERLLADLGAGLTVGIVALPLAMAFAIASGVKPEQGLYTAIVAGFLISALGGSQVQIGGPAGVLLFAMGWLKLGTILPTQLVEGRSARVISRVPGPIVALISLTLVSTLFSLPVETIGSRFGGIPQALPAFDLPEFTWATGTSSRGCATSSCRTARCCSARFS